MPNFHVGIIVIQCGKSCATILTDMPPWAKKLFDMSLEGVTDMLMADFTNVLGLTGMWPALVCFEEVQTTELLGTGRLAGEDGRFRSVEGVVVTTQRTLLHDFTTVGACHLHVKH